MSAQYRMGVLSCFIDYNALFYYLEMVSKKLLGTRPVLTIFWVLGFKTLASHHPSPPSSPFDIIPSKSPSLNAISPLSEAS